MEKAREHPAVPRVRACGIPVVNSSAAWCGAGLVVPVLGDKLCNNARLQMGTPDTFACYGFPGKIFPVDLLKKMKWIFFHECRNCET